MHRSTYTQTCVLHTFAHICSTLVHTLTCAHKCLHLDTLSHLQDLKTSTQIHIHPDRVSKHQGMHLFAHTAAPTSGYMHLTYMYICRAVYSPQTHTGQLYARQTQISSHTYQRKSGLLWYTHPHTHGTQNMHSQVYGSTYTPQYIPMPIPADYMSTYTCVCSNQ